MEKNPILLFKSSGIDVDILVAFEPGTRIGLIRLGDRTRPYRLHRFLERINKLSNSKICPLVP